MKTEPKWFGVFFLQVSFIVRGGPFNILGDKYPSLTWYDFSNSSPPEFFHTGRAPPIGYQMVRPYVVSVSGFFLFTRGEEG